MLIESVLLGGILLSCTLSGAALANSVHTRRAAANKARRVARGAIDDALGRWQNGVAIRLERLETDERTINFALNRAGILKGRLIAPDPDVIRLHQPPAAAAGGDDAA